MIYVLGKNRTTFQLLALAAWSLVFAAALVPGSCLSAEDPIESAGKALKSGGSTTPWYDAQKDEPRPLKVAPYFSSDDPNRRSNWEYVPSPQVTPTPATGGGGPGTTGKGWFTGISFFNVLGLSFLGLLLLALVIYLIWAFCRGEDEESQVNFAAEPKKGTVDRVSELPLQVGNVRGDFLSAARAEYEAGNYSQAVIYLFSYELLQLDRHQLIRLARGKTNRQYLREVRPRPELRSVLEQTMVAFEDVFFGKHSLGRERFESCWSRVDDFHRLLETAA